MIYIGIDPGITGAVAEIDSHGDIFIHDTPAILLKKGGKAKKDYLPLEMAAILKNYVPFNCHVFIERVHAMTGQGVTSMFNFGKGFGLWLGILAALRLPYTMITPQAWKKELMQGMPDKDAARVRAQQLFPQAMTELSRKKDVGRADALLIAEFGKRITNRQ